jgi:hypothetical protein
MIASTICGTGIAVSAEAQDPFARYSTPGQCEQAAIRLTKQYWRDKRPDTVVYAPATDSVPTSVIQAARACAARFNVQSVPEHELLNLAQLYLFTNQDDLARAALDRLLASKKQQDPVERGWTLSRIALSYLNARPTRMQEAKKYLQQLDALGAPAATWRMFTHTSFARHAMSINDLTTAVAEGNAAVTANTQMAKNDRIDWASSIISAYTSLADPTSVVTDGAAAIAVLERAKTDVFPLRPEGSRELEMLKNSIRQAIAPYTLFGTKSVPLEADHWYNTNGDNGTRPKPGSVSLIVFGFHACGGGCYPTYATLKRLHSKFGERGLEIVMVASTSGYYRNQLVQPPEESDSAGGYFAEFLKLPGVVAVSESEFRRVPDGRRVNVPTANARNYSRGRSAVLVDKQGTIRLLVNAVPEREKVLETAIEAALQ